MRKHTQNSTCVFWYVMPPPLMGKDRLEFLAGWQPLYQLVKLWSRNKFIKIHSTHLGKSNTTNRLGPTQGLRDPPPALAQPPEAGPNDAHHICFIFRDSKRFS